MNGAHVFTNLIIPMSVIVNALKRERERSSHDYLMNDDVPVNHSA